MSQVGQSRPNWAFRAMSVSPPSATELRTSLVVRFVPILLQKSACRRRGTVGAIFEAVRCHPLDCAGDLRSTLLTLATLRSAQRGDWWWPGDQLSKPAEVLSNRSQRELELGTAWPAQSQPAEPKNTFQMRKKHLGTFAVVGWFR